MQAGWSTRIMFYLFAFPEPTMLSGNRAYFWPTFTWIPNPCVRHVIVVDWAGTFWISQQHWGLHPPRETVVPPLSWDGLIHCGTCSVMDTVASWTWYLWDTNVCLYWQFEREAPWGVLITFSLLFCNLCLSAVAVRLPACRLLNITTLKNEIWMLFWVKLNQNSCKILMWLLGVLTCICSDSRHLQCFS